MIPPLRPALAALILLIGWTSATAVRGDEPKKDDPPPGLTAEERAKNVESFEVVWKTIRDTHFDPKLGGLDWQAVHDELKPRVEKAATMAEARAAMSEALERLHQTHFGIIGGDVAHEIDDDAAGGDGEAGIDVRMVEGKIVVTSVAAGSPAEKAGVRTGWVVEAIRGKPVSRTLAAVEKAYAKSGMVAARKVMAVEHRLHGFPGASVAVDFLDAKDKPVHLDLTLDEPKGVPARFGNLPTFHVKLVSKRVEGTVGYVGLNIFFHPVHVVAKFAEALKAHRDAEGLILDLRGNPGGVGMLSMGIGGWFVTEPDRKLGTMITRDGSLHFALNPRPEPFTAPLAVLVDELSMSTSEILAGGLQDLKRAKVFGARTPGAALPSRVDLLPNGDAFQYAFANYIAVGGKPLEGVGVVPDVEAPLTRAALLEGRDPAVEAAVRWIRSQSKTKAKAP